MMVADHLQNITGKVNVVDVSVRSVDAFGDDVVGGYVICDCTADWKPEACVNIAVQKIT